MGRIGPERLAHPKVAIIDVNQAILATADGRAARLGLEGEFRSAINALEEHARTDAIAADRQMEDLQRDIQAERTRVLQDLGKKMSAVIGKYAARKHYEAVLDVSDPNSPVMWFKKTNDITHEIVAEYDRIYSLGSLGSASRRK